jgi:hypothetical protein
VVGPEAQGQHVDQAPLQEATDLHTAPEHRHRFAPLGQVRQGGDDLGVGLKAVVIGDSQLAQAEVGRLAGQFRQRRTERRCLGQHLLAQGARAGDQPGR